MTSQEIDAIPSFIVETTNENYLDYLIVEFSNVGFAKKSKYFAEDNKQAVREILAAYPFDEDFGPLPRQRAITLSAWFAFGNADKKLPDCQKHFSKMIDWLESTREKPMDFINSVSTDELDRFHQKWNSPEHLDLISKDVEGLTALVKQVKIKESDKEDFLAQLKVIDRSLAEDVIEEPELISQLSASNLKNSLLAKFDEKYKSAEWKLLKNFSFEFKEKTNFSYWLLTVELPDHPDFWGQLDWAWDLAVSRKRAIDLNTEVKRQIAPGQAYQPDSRKGSSWSVPGGVGFYRNSGN